MFNSFEIFDGREVHDNLEVFDSGKIFSVLNILISKRLRNIRCLVDVVYLIVIKSLTMLK